VGPGALAGAALDNPKTVAPAGALARRDTPSPEAF